jgi:hypothetical protein
MERRHDRRICAQNPVRIHSDEGTCVTGATRNISSGGLCLESSQIQCLKKNTLVSAAFKANGELVILPSQAVRAGNDQTALMFVVRVSDYQAALMFIHEGASWKKLQSTWLEDVA